jgi:hypothetical protein
LRLGPVGRTRVHAQTREVAGPSIAAPGLGARLELPVLESLLVGADLGMLFEGESELKPQSPTGSYELHANGLILDMLVSAKPVWRPFGDGVELYASGGVGLSVRPLMSGNLPLTDDEGATELSMRNGFSSEIAWGLIAQVGLGGTFWLSPRFCVFFELAALARQAHAEIEDTRHGDYLLQITDTQALVLAGFGAALGEP